METTGDKVSAFINIRKEFYSFLYAKFLKSECRLCGPEEFRQLCRINGLFSAARIFAEEQGHLRKVGLGWFRLSAAGIEYAEQFLAEEEE